MRIFLFYVLAESALHASPARAGSPCTILKLHKMPSRPKSAQECLILSYRVYTSHSRRVFPQIILFFSCNTLFSKCLTISATHSKKKRCDEKDRLIISKCIFSMLWALLSEKVDGKQFRIKLRLIQSCKKSIRPPGTTILGEIGQI